MPASFDELISQTAVPDTVTDDELEDMRQEITRDVTAVLMFGVRPVPEGRESRRAIKLDRASFYLKSLSCRLLRSDDASGHLAGIARDPGDIDGALHFGCLLNLAQEPEGAMWWWQFAAGAGDATAAYCLYLLHLSRGELRDAGHWIGQAFTLEGRIDFIPPPLWSQQLDPPSMRLREAVGRLRVEEVAGARFHHPDHRLAGQIEGLDDVR